MVKKSILKRASYFCSALILMLATVPIGANGRAYADGGPSCASDETTLTQLLSGTEPSFSFCGNIAKTINITRDVEIDLAGNTLTGKVVVYEGHTVTIKNGVIAGATINDNIVSNKGTLTLENVNITANTYPAVNSNGGTALIKSGTYRTNGVTLLSAKNNGTVTVDGGDFTGGISGTVTVNGGKFTANPTNFLGAGKDAYAFTGYWMVGDETTITTTAVNNGKVPVGVDVDIFRVTAAEYNEMNFTIKRSDGSEHPEDVTITTREEGGEVIVSAKANNASTKTIILESNSGKTATAKLYVHTIGGVNDQVMFAGTEHVMGITTSKDVTWSLINSSDTAVATVSGDTITAVGSGMSEITVEFNNAVHTQQTFNVYVYDFDTTEDTLLIEKGKTKDVITDSNWDVAATATSGGSKVQLTDKGGKYRVKGLEAGEAVVEFTTSVNGTDLSKTVKVYVYEVKEKDVTLEKGVTLTESRINEIIDTGSNDVAMSFKKFSVNGKAENNGLELTGIEAGDTVATYNLTVDGKTASAKFNLHVWEMVTEDLADEYEVGNLVPTTGAFRVYDENGAISYTVKNAAGEDVNDIVVNQNGNQYTIQMADGAMPGEYTVRFIDTVAGQEVASKSVAVRVHRIETTGEDEHYIVMTRNPFATSENRYDMKVTEFSGFTQNRNITATVSGSSLGGVTVTYRHGGNWRITAQEAGSYDVIFSDGVASKTIHVYVMQFTFGQDSYHVLREDGNAGALINAINNYWHDENVLNGYTDTEFVVVNDETGTEVTSGYGVNKTIAPLPPEGEEYGFKWCLNDECLPAGNYTITFKAYANNKQGQATKSVRLHIYEMVAPQEDLYIINTGDSLNIDVHDLNDRALTSATIEVVDGAADGLEFETSGFWFFTTTDYSKLNATKPGVYTVHYTDYMNNGTIAGTHDATVVVIEVEHETLFVRKGETVDLTGNAAWSASYATDIMSGEDYEAEGGVIKYNTTGMDLGMRWVTVAHDFTEFDDGEFPPREMVNVITVVVYDVTGDAMDDMVSDADRASVANFVAGHIATMIENGSTDGDEKVVLNIDIDELEALLYAGAEVETRLEAELLDESEWEDAEAGDKVVLKIEDESGIVAMYEVYLVIYANNNKIGLVYELDDAITMRLEIPEEYRNAANGYTRTFTVTRGHLAKDGTETAETLEVTRDGDYLVFKNKKFSSFAISYTDIFSAPDTGFVMSEGGSASASSSLAMVVATIMGAITMIGAAVFAKRH